MEMSVDDDDGFWDNDDFIATIENVVKKAEEASAAKHGGTPTQSGAPTPHSSSAIVPPKKNNFRIGEVGPSAHGAISGYAENALTEYRGISSIGTPQPQALGRQQVSVQSMNHQGQVAVHGSHQALQELSMFDQPPRGADGVGQLMAEKDGMISFLRSRVQEAEQQLDELRQRVGPQNLSHPALHQQQLELERLSAQLMFKDHEVVEGQRARAENEGRLRDALAETAALKEELEKLKNSRKIGAELKRPRNEANIDGFEHQWSPPWVPNRTSEADGNTSTGLRSAFLKDAHEVEERLTPVEVPIETHQMEVGGHGGNREESTKIDKLQTNENHNRDMSRRAEASTSGRADGEEVLSTDQLSNFSRTSEMYYSLQHLWGFKGVGNDGISLLSKLYASCRQDLYKLFSNTESQVVKSLGSAERGKELEAKRGTISEKLHTALAKVTNGLAHPEIMISPLLEFCTLESVRQPLLLLASEAGWIISYLHLCVQLLRISFMANVQAQLVGSALHVLRCILQHDNTCRQNLLLRGSEKSVDRQVGIFSSFKILENEKQNAENKGWYIESVPNEGGNLQTSFRVIFSSPRIFLQAQVGDGSVQQIHDTRGFTESGAHNGGEELNPQPKASDEELQRQASEHEEAGVNDSGVPTEGLNLLVKWMLQLALTSSSPNVKFEAIANIGVLVNNSEPLTERSMFGPLLCHGAIDLLLKDSSRAEIQLQAVKIVHLLLHCPTIIQRFCVADEGDKNILDQSKLVNNETGNPSVGGHGQGGISDGQTLEKSKTGFCPAPKQAPYTELSKLKLLEGLTECLKHTGNSRQGYALHISVIRLVSFIVAFGESGAAALIQTRALFEDAESGRAGKVDAKADEVVRNGEGASGEQTVGDGSGATHFKGGQDLSDKGNGIPIALAEESVDDSERAQNIPQRLLNLIASELDIEEREEWNEPSITEERDHLIYEAVTLLCRLASDTVQSRAVIGHLISNKDMARLTLSVTNRLVSRKSHCKQSWAAQSPAAPSNSDTSELARTLRERVLSILEETSPFSFYQ